MSDDLLLVRLLVVCAASQIRDRIRQGAASVTVPVEVIEADSVARARSIISANDTEIAMLDLATVGADSPSFVAAARAARQPPLIVLATADRKEAHAQAAGGAVADGIVVRPASADQARV